MNNNENNTQTFASFAKYSLGTMKIRNFPVTDTKNKKSSLQLVIFRTTSIESESSNNNRSYFTIRGDCSTEDRGKLVREFQVPFAKILAE